MDVVHEDVDHLAEGEDLEDSTAWERSQYYRKVQPVAPKRDGRAKLLRTRKHKAKTDMAQHGIETGQVYKTSYYQQRLADDTLRQWNTVEVVRQ